MLGSCLRLWGHAPALECTPCWGICFSQKERARTTVVSSCWFTLWILDDYDFRVGSSWYFCQDRSFKMIYSAFVCNANQLLLERDFSCPHSGFKKKQTNIFLVFKKPVFKEERPFLQTWCGWLVLPGFPRKLGARGRSPCCRRFSYPCSHSDCCPCLSSGAASAGACAICTQGRVLARRGSVFKHWLPGAWWIQVVVLRV